MILSNPYRYKLPEDSDRFVIYSVPENIYIESHRSCSRTNEAVDILDQHNILNGHPQRHHVLPAEAVKIE